MGDPVYFLGGGEGAFGLFAGVEAEFAARVRADQSFVDSLAQDHGQQADDVGDAAVAQAAA
ncbi:hypothetical protein [Amycolatopsis magusensis]|uniref:hypothetical protein n=1 Tax=Amycolatopsis magusensis TaxID=882444 RepID=UPI0037B6CED0